MTRADMIAAETYAAKTYRREAGARRANPALAAQLMEWSRASEARAECLRSGPLFRQDETAPGQAVAG